MAKLKNCDTIWTAPAGQAVTVGNNRTITRDESGVFTCRLHGHAVATVAPQGASGIAYVTLDTCGFMTTTTISAMRDFMGAFGISAAASRAGGVLSAQWKMPGGAWRVKTSDNGAMSFTGHRYV